MTMPIWIVIRRFDDYGCKIVGCFSEPSLAEAKKASLEESQIELIERSFAVARKYGNVFQLKKEEYIKYSDEIRAIQSQYDVTSDDWFYIEEHAL